MPTGGTPAHMMEENERLNKIITDLRRRVGELEEQTEQTIANANSGIDILKKQREKLLIEKERLSKALAESGCWKTLRAWRGKS